MIAAISTSVADTMSQPNAIATPLMSSRKSSLFPILRARFRNARHIGLAPYAAAREDGGGWTQLDPLQWCLACDMHQHARPGYLLSTRFFCARPVVRWRLLVVEVMAGRWGSIAGGGSTLGAKESPPPDTPCKVARMAGGGFLCLICMW